MDLSKYKVTRQYPMKPKRPTISATATAAEARAYVDALELYEKNLEQYRKESQAYDAEERGLVVQFKTDVLAENGLTGHPKADNVFAMAWEQGHASGIHEVSDWVERLAELVK